jgi:hypothetical protein
MLHIHNGDSSAGTLKESKLAGEHFAFREALIAGATPKGLSNDEWLRVRARFLADDYTMDFQQCYDGLSQQQQTLATLDRHEEVILWFEHDCFCQLHLVYLLQHIAAINLPQTALSLVCINEFPGKEDFRGLGELNPEQMASLFDKRTTVSDEQKLLAQKTWQAYCSATPEPLMTLLQQDTSALPFLQAALQKHLARFPSTQNGLGLIENRALELLRDGHRNFSELFPAFTKLEPLFGFGDAQLWNILMRLAQATEPALTIEIEDLQQAMESGAFLQAPMQITGFGEAVLAGNGDFIRTNGINEWLGGVHLSAKQLWRWQPETQMMLPEHSLN